MAARLPTASPRPIAALRGAGPRVTTRTASAPPCSRPPTSVRHLLALYAFNSRDRPRARIRAASRCRARSVCNGGATPCRARRAATCGRTRSRRRSTTRSSGSACRAQLSSTSIDARIFDLYDDPMPTLNDLEGYCGETSSCADPAREPHPRRRRRSRQRPMPPAMPASPMRSTGLLRAFPVACAARAGLSAGGSSGPPRRRARRHRHRARRAGPEARPSPTCARRPPASRAGAHAARHDPDARSRRPSGRSRWSSPISRPWSGGTTIRSRRSSTCRNGASSRSWGRPARQPF